MAALQVNLTDEEEKKIREQVEKIEVVGDRYSSVFEKYCLGDTPPLR